MIGIVTAEDFHPGIYFNNDVGGTDQLPGGRYRVDVVRVWNDYETGARAVGTLVDAADIAKAIEIGTTGYAPEGQVYRPTTVYFNVDQFKGE